MSARPAVLITGAGGFVGSALAEGFTTLGWRVTAVDRAFDEASRTRLAGSDLVTADLGASGPVDLPAVPFVIHAAAITTDPTELGWTAAAHVAANTQPLLQMLEHAARTRSEAFVFVSSSGVFAATDGHGALTDVDPPTGRSPYAAAKRAGELLTVAALEGIVAAHVVRLGYLYGPGEVARPSRTRPSAVARWLAAARAGQPLEVPANDPARDWTFTPDLALVVARLLAVRPAEHAVHVCSPFVATDSAMATRIAAQVPGARVTTMPGAVATKPPLQASDLSRLGQVKWTAPEEALAHLASEVCP